MSNVIILGSSGFIGRSLVAYLKQFTDLNVSISGRSKEDILVDLNAPENINLDAFKAGDVVVFLASVSSPDICTNQPDLANKINVISTIWLIKNLTLRGVKVIFSSSDVVFKGGDNIYTDGSPLSPVSLYGKMKREVEDAFISNPLVKVARFSYVLGRGDKYTEMLLKSESTNEEVDVFEGFYRNIVTLDDVLDGILKLVLNWEAIENYSINFCGPHLVSKYELTEKFSNFVAPKLKFSLIDAPASFWLSRPKKIEMRSSIFPEILGRSSQTLEEYLEGW